MKKLFYYQNLNRIKAVLSLYGIASARVKPETDLVHDLGFRNLEKLSLMLEIEEALHAESLFDGPDGMKTIDDILLNIEKKHLVPA
jgi:hypothetical protein